MSFAQSPGAQLTARQTTQLIKKTTAQLTGRQRGPDRRVRRQSYDVDDARAKVWTAINGGSKAGGLRWRDTLLKVVKEYDVWAKQRGKRGPVGPFAIRVLEELLQLLDFKTGRLDPAIARIMARTGFAKQTVVSALARLKAHGFLRWVRRSRRIDGAEGPVRKQTSNAYYFDLRQLPARVWQRFRDVLARRELAATGDLTPEPRAPMPSPRLAAELAALDEAIARRDANLG